MTNIQWESAGKFEDIRYEKAEGIAKITINRPEVRNAFRPLTVIEMQRALDDAREDQETGVIILTGEGPTPSARAGIRRYEETPDTSKIPTRPVAPREESLSGASTSRTCTYRSGVAPNLSLRWWQDTPSAVATSCTWCATSPSLLITRSSGRSAQR